MRRLVIFAAIAIIIAILITIATVWLGLAVLLATLLSVGTIGGLLAKSWLEDYIPID